MSRKGMHRIAVPYPISSEVRLVENCVRRTSEPLLTRCLVPIRTPIPTFAFSSVHKHPVPIQRLPKASSARMSSIVTNCRTTRLDIHVLIVPRKSTDIRELTI